MEKGRACPSFFYYCTWHTLDPMKLRTLVLVTLLGLPVTALSSTLYKCTDASGAVLFTNQKTSKKNCTVLIQQTAPASAAARPRAYAQPTPGDFPRVSNDQQRARDSDRHAILEKEMAAEQQNLEQARKSLAIAGPQAVPGLRDTAALHERNIEALKKELAKLR
jgi:hypothetical protein